ncbi:Uncharacterised protein [Mycobacteroides abscessus subsp. abscessus]|nr:Uncharacterised protein [Mycobacteroides abscessus subsp. abscessus]
MWMPVGLENIDAVVVRAQAARRIAPGRMAFRVYDLRAGRVYVLPAGACQPVTEVDVLHVHEVARVESADGVECRTPQQ